VSTFEFVFAMRCAGPGGSGAIVGDVAANVFQRAGCRSDEVAALVTELNAVVKPCVDRHEDVDVRFHAAGHSCEVVVKVDDRELWRSSRRIP
jgi:hypothetical protein